MLFWTNSECVFIYSQVTSVMRDPLVEALWTASRWPMPGRWVCSQGRSNPGKSLWARWEAKENTDFMWKSNPEDRLGFRSEDMLIFYHLGPWRSLSNWVIEWLRFDLGKLKSASHTDQGISFCIWQQPMYGKALSNCTAEQMEFCINWSPGRRMVLSEMLLHSVVERNFLNAFLPW